jgi:DNA-binding beta-propeller fold protein YncE
MLLHGGVLVVADSEQETIFGVDPATGARADISSGTVGTGLPAFPVAMDLDAAGNRVIVSDGNEDAIVGISLVNGDRVILSSEDVGAGPEIASPGGLIFDPAGNRAVVVDFPADLVFSVDLATGIRTVLSSAGGPALTQRGGAVRDTANDRMLVAAGLGGIVAVDLATGMRRVVSGPGVGGGPFRRPDGIALDPDRQIALVADFQLRAAVAVDVQTGERIVISR